MTSLDMTMGAISGRDGGGKSATESKRITVGEIARELAVSIPTVYAMLRERKIPNIRQGKLFIVSREAFGRWLGTCGMDTDTP
jgi:excisionase family DNA binding protein